MPHRSLLPSRKTTMGALFTHPLAETRSADKRKNKYVVPIINYPVNSPSICGLYAVLPLGSLIPAKFDIRKRSPGSRGLFASLFCSFGFLVRSFDAFVRFECYLPPSRWQTEDFSSVRATPMGKSK